MRNDDRSTVMADAGEDDDIGQRDFFTDETLLADPYAYYEALRSKCPVQREPHHGVVAVTGYDEVARGLEGPGRLLRVQLAERAVSRVPGVARGP